MCFMWFDTCLFYIFFVGRALASFVGAVLLYILLFDAFVLFVFLPLLCYFFVSF